MDEVVKKPISYRNRGYFDGWKKYFQEARCKSPGEVARYVDLINLDQVDGYKYKKLPKDEFLKRLEAMEVSEDYIFLINNLDLPDEITLNSRDTKVQLNIVPSDMEEELKKVKYFSKGRMFIPAPEMLIKWMTDNSATLYLGVLGTLEEKGIEWPIIDIDRTESDLNYTREITQFKEFNKEFRSPQIVKKLLGEEEKEDVTRLLFEYSNMTKLIRELFELDPTSKDSKNTLEKLYRANEDMKLKPIPESRTVGLM